MTLSQATARVQAAKAAACAAFIGVLVAGVTGQSLAQQNPAPGSNPIIRDRFTADPAPLVVGDTLYLYVGHDEAKGNELFNIREWLCYSTKDMKTWTPHGAIMKPTDFKWAVRDAWAAQVVQRDGKFYFYTTVHHDDTNGGKAIGVAVSDSPTGPFVDARGSALVTERTTPSPYGWNDIDPTVFVDDDGTAWLAWGNPVLYLARLKPNMIELDGPIEKIALPNYTEGPWLHKRNGLYYLTYPSFAHQGLSERICYATAPKVIGPWTYRGLLTGPARNSYTIHPGIAEFKGQSYLFYHNAALTLPDGQRGATGRRAVCVEYLYYNHDGTMQPVVQTEAGVSVPPQPAPQAKPTPIDHGKTDAGVTVAQFEGGYPSAWPGTPAIASASDPFTQTPTATGFNRDGGVTSIGQTFVPKQDIRLARISLYAGDGNGTDAKNPLALALYDLGPADAATEAYAAGTNLLGAGQGLNIAYQPQGAGLLHVDFDTDRQVLLKDGRRYALELQGAKDSTAFFWRSSRSDVYPDGAAYRDRKLSKERDGKLTDFAFALYGSN